MQRQTGLFTRGRSLFAALLIVVLAVGLFNPIGWAQDSTPEIDSLDEICATLEASPDASPAIGTPESDTSGADIGTEAGTPETGMAMEGSPAAELEADLCGTPTS